MNLWNLGCPAYDFHEKTKIFWSTRSKSKVPGATRLCWSTALLIGTKNHCSNGLNFFMHMPFLIAQQILPWFIYFLSVQICTVEPLFRVNPWGQGKCPLNRGVSKERFHCTIFSVCVSSLWIHWLYCQWPKKLLWFYTSRWLNLTAQRHETCLHDCTIMSSPIILGSFLAIYE